MAVLCRPYLYPFESFRTSISRTDSVVEWLGHIRLNVETECMSVLQGKSLDKEFMTRSEFYKVKTIRGKENIIFRSFMYF